MKLNFSHQTETRVRYGETDQMGYCYYGNYAQYFEIGRVEALRSIGCSYKMLEQSGIMLPVREFTVQYIRPGLYDDLLTITTFIKEINGVKILFDYELHNEKGELISTGHTTLVFVKKETMRPTPAPTSFLHQLKKYELQQSV